MNCSLLQASYPKTISGWETVDLQEITHLGYWKQKSWDVLTEHEFFRHVPNKCQKRLIVTVLDSLLDESFIKQRLVKSLLQNSLYASFLSLFCYRSLNYQSTDGNASRTLKTYSEINLSSIVGTIFYNSSKSQSRWIIRFMIRKKSAPTFFHLIRWTYCSFFDQGVSLSSLTFFHHISLCSVKKMYHNVFYSINGPWGFLMTNLKTFTVVLNHKATGSPVDTNMMKTCQGDILLISSVIKDKRRLDDIRWRLAATSFWSWATVSTQQLLAAQSDVA